MPVRTAALLLLALPALALAQGKTTDPFVPMGSLSQEETARLYNRALGTWRLNRDKSTIISGDTLGVPPGYVYSPTEDRKGVNFKSGSSNTTSVQMWDGKPYGEKSTIARSPIDEFTIDNVLASNGRRTGRNTQIYSTDGTKAAYIVRRLTEQGLERVISVVLYEKVPDGSDISKPLN